MSTQPGSPPVRLLTPSWQVRSLGNPKRKPDGMDCHWGASEADPPRRLAFIAGSIGAGGLAVQAIPLGPREQAMDLIADPVGWQLLTSQQRSSHPLVQRNPNRLRQRPDDPATPKTEFRRPLPGVVQPEGSLYVGASNQWHRGGRLTRSQGSANHGEPLEDTAGCHGAPSTV